jgi:hypothetical protein
MIMTFLLVTPIARLMALLLPEIARRESLAGPPLPHPPWEAKCRAFRRTG